MSSLVDTVAIAAASTLPAVYTGLLVGYLLRGPSSAGAGARLSDRLLFLTTVAAGLAVWYFLDIMADSTFLGINQGLSSTTVELVGLFILGAFVTVFVEPMNQPSKSFDPLFLAAAIIAVHGIGEGVAMGSTLSGSLAPIAAVGGPFSAASFVIHKGLEAFIAGVLASAAGRYHSRLVLAGLVIGVPIIFGAALGYLIAPNAAFFFALGGGASIWLLTVLLNRSLTLTSRFKWSLALTTGILLMFLAGLLHSG